MVSLKRTSQGGLQVFIAVAIVLAIVTVSVASFVKNRGETARRNQAIALADKITSSQNTTKSEEGSTPADSTKSNAQVVADDKSKDSTVKGTGDLPDTGPAENAIISVVELGILSVAI